MNRSERGYLFGITYDNLAAEVRCPALPMRLAPPAPACIGDVVVLRIVHKITTGV